MEEFEKVPVLQESGFRQLFENCPVGVALYTLDERRIALANPSMHRMLGYAPGELSGKHWNGTAATTVGASCERIRSAVKRWFSASFVISQLAVGEGMSVGSGFCVPND